MADDPIERLEKHGRRPTPPIDGGFADRLESKLRADHASQVPTRRSRVPALLPQLAFAVLLIAAIASVFALRGGDSGQPIAVVEGDTPIADQPPDVGGDADPTGAGEPPPTATPTATPEAEPAPTTLATPTAVAGGRKPTPTPDAATPPVDEDASGVTTPPNPSPTPLVETERATPGPAATATPVPSVTSEPTGVVLPTATPSTTVAPATSVPAPTATPTPTPTPTPTATPSPIPTATPTPTTVPEPVDLALLCRSRTVGDVVGVVCEWRAPATDRTVAVYEVTRSRNGGEAVVVSRQRATAPLQFADRDVAAGDTVLYLVRALDAEERIVAASVRESVVVPG